MARIIDAFTQFFDDNGDPLVDGLLKFYESGTNNTDKNTYADINETIANTNPVELDGAGRCPNVFGDGSYNVISYTSASVQIEQFDPVGATGSTGAFADWNAITIYDEGDIVTGSDGFYYRSISAANQNQDPVSSPGQWEEVTLNQIWNTNRVYGAGDSVYASDGLIYISRVAANSGNDPTTDDANWRLLSDSPNLLENAGFTASVASKALTYALKSNNLSDPTAADKVIASFRSATLTTGNYDVVSAVTALNIVVPDGATLGFAAAENTYTYLYLINNAGTMEPAVSSTILDQAILHTTVAIDATADAIDTLYSTVARTNVAIRILGRIKIETGAVPGEWDNAPTELVVDAFLQAEAAAIGYIKLSDVKAAGTQGGTFTSGAWQTRILNTEDTDTGGNCTLSANQFTLDAGTYRISAIAPALVVDRHKAVLYNASDASNEIIGSSTSTSSGDIVSTHSTVAGEFTIASSKTFEIRHQCSTTQATNGLGQASNFAVSEIYTVVELWKVA